MYQYTCDSKYCATCSCWSGERKICDPFGSWREVSSPMATGQGMNRKSGCFQQTKQANGGCSAHEKWGALRYSTRLICCDIHIIDTAAFWYIECVII